MRLLPLLVLMAGCADSDGSCSGDVQWAPFDVNGFTPLCDGDDLTIREFDATTFLVDLNLQFRDIAGDGAVSGVWTLSFDSALSADETSPEVPSFASEDGWWRVHAMHWLAEDSAAAVSALDGTTATLSATFTDSTGTTASSSLDLVAVAP